MKNVTTTLQAIKDEYGSITKKYKLIEIDFIDAVIKKNGMIAFAAAILSIVIQSLNIYRVLFMTNAGLSTMNNRIYFTFYLSLFLASLLVIGMHIHWNPLSRTFYYLYIVYALFYIYWNLLLDSYSISNQTGGSNIIFITSLVFTSILFRFKLWHGISIQIVSYTTFLLLNFNSSDMGGIINVTIVSLVSILCSVLLFAQEVNSIYNAHELIKTNKKLINEEDKLRMELEKHQLIMRNTNLFSFDWNLAKNTLIPSRNCSETLGWPPLINEPLHWLTQHDGIFTEDRANFLELIHTSTKEKTNASMDIRLKDYSDTFVWYRIQLFVQCDYTNEPNTIIGVLLNIDGTTRLIHNLNKQLKGQLEGTKKYFNYLKDTQEKTIIYRHDMRHSLKLLEQLASQGNMEKLCDYLSETHNKLDTITPNHYCANETSNLILGSFEQLAHKNHVTFTTDVSLPTELPIEDTVLCSLLFNLLENAITAAKQVKDNPSRSVHVKAIFKNNKLIIFTENDFSGTVTIENDLPVSPSIKEGHGFGIKSIINIVEQHSGLYTFETQEQKFYAKILLEI